MAGSLRKRGHPGKGDDETITPCAVSTAARLTARYAPSGVLRFQSWLSNAGTFRLLTISSSLVPRTITARPSHFGSIYVSMMRGVLEGVP